MFPSPAFSQCPIHDLSKKEEEKKEENPKGRDYQGVYYSDYLGLEKVLHAQNPVTKHHDEMLFIVTHQAFELWFKQIIYELNSVCDIFSNTPVPESAMLLTVRRLHRMTEIQRVLISQFKILETMTPMEFIDFRDALVPASGFQSVQFRELEILLGLPESNRSSLGGCTFLSAFNTDHEEYLKKVMKKTSLFEAVQNWLERTPFTECEDWDFWDEYQKAVNKMTERDRYHIETEWQGMEVDVEVEEKKKAISNVEHKFAALFDPNLYNELKAKGHFRLSQKAMKSALLIELYRHEPIFHLPFEFLEAIVDFDQNMSLFRHSHATMVHRMIGSRMGTGGSSGVYYLRSTTGLRYKVFNDLINISTFMIPTAEIPPIPSHWKTRMNFSMDFKK